MIRKEDIRPGAYLPYADLNYADLSGTDLSGANLSDSGLSDADLRRANLSGANLSWADLGGANLSWANLIGADLYAADLRKANLSNTKGIPPMICQEKGTYIGYKKAEIWEKDHYAPVIVTLEVPETAKRSSATTNKCRCSEAKVISIESLDGTKKYERATSSYCRSFVYEVGKTVKVDDFDDDRWSECAPGIHHFMTRKEAEEYWF